MSLHHRPTRCVFVLVGSVLPAVTPAYAAFSFTSLTGQLFAGNATVPTPLPDAPGVHTAGVGPSVISWGGVNGEGQSISGDFLFQSRATATALVTPTAITARISASVSISPVQIPPGPSDWFPGNSSASGQMTLRFSVSEPMLVQISDSRSAPYMLSILSGPNNFVWRDRGWLGNPPQLLQPGAYELYIYANGGTSWGGNSEPNGSGGGMNAWTLQVVPAPGVFACCLGATPLLLARRRR